MARGAKALFLQHHFVNDFNSHDEADIVYLGQIFVQ
jgi:hypothetical protein